MKHRDFLENYNEAQDIAHEQYVSSKQFYDDQSKGESPVPGAARRILAFSSTVDNLIIMITEECHKLRLDDSDTVLILNQVKSNVSDLIDGTIKYLCPKKGVTMPKAKATAKTTKVAKKAKAKTASCKKVAAK